MTTFIDINITDSTGAFNVGELEQPERKINQPLVSLHAIKTRTGKDECDCAPCRAARQA